MVYKGKIKAKKAQMPAFAWLFSIIVGAVILFLAFFFVTQYGKQVQQPTQQVILGSGINILLEPFTAIGSLAEARSSILEFPASTYIEFGCNANADYSEIKAKNVEHRTFDLAKKTYDKYIFSQQITTKEKERLLGFSLPIRIPFYVATATILTKGNYCFVNLPLHHKNTLEAIDDYIHHTKYNFTYVSSAASCPPGYIKVCTSGCDININCLSPSCTYGFVGNKPWLNELLLAAIFSEEETYHCNLDRILERAKVLASIYKKKADSLQQKGCAMGGMTAALDLYVSEINKFKINKNNPSPLYNAIAQIQNINSALSGDCKLL